MPPIGMDHYSYGPAMSPDWIIAVATVFAAVGTVAAVVIAVQRDWILEKRRRPKLELTFDPANRNRSLDLVTVGPADDLVHWVRPRVSNARGCRSAENVEVFLLRCERQDTTGPHAPVNERPLSWSGVREPDGKTRITRTLIPPGVTRHIDLFSVQQEDGEAKARLRVVPEPRDDRHKFNEGKFDIELILAAQDIDAKRYAGSISYDGGWTEGGEFWQHIDVQIARAD
jgi:hypothetical protein